VGIDVGSFRAYVQEREHKLRAAAYLLCGDWHTADDLVQTVWTQLFRHWPRVSKMDKPDGYVYTALTNVWRNEIRSRSRRPESPYAEVPERAVASDGTEAVLDRQSILALLAELPEGQRAVLVLRYYGDLSVEETALTLGCSTGTVKSQTARALEKLRVRLAQSEGEQWIS
jgi:RNA polymerase sigma-70 factor (sigma-E family)